MGGGVKVMSNTVDNRAVQMGFDNKQFESGVKTSIESLNNLKKGLNLTESAKSLENLAHAGRTFTLGNIAEGVQNISNRFSALGIVGITVLQNLTNAAINYGKKIIDSMITPIKTGLTEYETQINAIQTVLANTESKGTTLNDVNEALNRLNEYSDKTIYNFTEMTRNIGTFTAAGIDLDTSVAAIKGIANLAAISGSNSQQASTAMYQLSQALASGTVKLMDWNSVVNAGMGGQVFQDALKETARVHGIAIDDMLKSEGSFRNTLEKGWLSSQILTETLSKFTGDLTAEQLKSMGYTEDQIASIIKLGQTATDAATKVKTFSQLKDTLKEAIQSGWSKSWQLVIGDFNEAKTFFSDVSDTLGAMISASSDARNSVLQDWKTIGGRTFLIEALKNAFEGVLSIIKPIKEAFREIFPPITGIQLAELTAIIRNLAEKLKIGADTADKLKRIFKGLFAGVDILKELVIALATAFFGLTSSIVPSGASILDFLANIGDFILKVRDAIKANDTFNVAIKNIGVFLTEARLAVINFANDFRAKFEMVKSWLSGLFENVHADEAGNFFGNILDRITARFEPLKKFLESINARFEPLTTLGKVLGFVLTSLVNILKKAFPLFFKLASGVGSFMSKIGTAIAEGVADLNFEKIFDVLNSGLIAAVILAVRNFINSGSGLLNSAGGIFEQFSGILKGVTGILDGVKGSLQAWQQAIKAQTLLTIAIALGILTASLIALSMIDSKKLTTALAAITAMFGQLMASMAIYSKLSGPTGGIGAGASLIALSVSLLILTGAVSQLSKLNPDELARGLNAIAVLSLGLLVFTKEISRNTGTIIKGSGSLVVLAISLEILVDVVKRLGNLDPAKLTNGLIGIGVLLAELAAFMKVTNLDRMGLIKGAGLMLLASSLLIISSVVSKLGEMDVNDLKQGLVAIATIFTELALFVKLTGDSKKVVSTAIGLTILGGAMLIFSEVLERMGSLTWEEIARGLTAMAGSLLLIFGAMRLLPTNMIVTGAGLVVVAAALVILSNALKSMGGMSWDEIGRGLTVLGGALAILTLGLYAMQGTISGAIAMIVVASALAILAPALQTLGSMSFGEIGKGLLSLAGVFLVLGIAGYALTPVVPTLLLLSGSILLLGVAISAIGVGVLAFSAGLAALAVSGTAGAIALVSIVSIILGLVPLLVKSLVDAVILLAKLITEAAPVIGEALKVTLLTLIDVIVSVTPPLLEALKILLLKLIDTIVTVVPKFIDALMLLVGKLLSTLADNLPKFLASGIKIIMTLLKGIRDNIGDIVKVAIDIVTNFIDAVTEKLPDVIDSGFDLIIAFINGLASSIKENGPELNKAVGNLAQAIVDGLCDGLTSGVSGVVAAISKLAGAAIDTLKTLLGIFSPSRVAKELFSYVPLGAIEGLDMFGDRVKSSSENLGQKAIDGISSAISNVVDIFTSDMDMNPTIRPVVDLSDVISGKKELEAAFAGRSFDISANITKLASVANGLSQINVPTVSNDATTQQPSQVVFNQNNYSPKALSRIEIYRQTKNLITAKGLV